jgi:hypothetical protein
VIVVAKSRFRNFVLDTTMPSQILYSEPIVIFEKLTKEVRGESTFLHGDESCWVFFSVLLHLGICTLLACSGKAATGSKASRSTRNTTSD